MAGLIGLADEVVRLHGGWMDCEGDEIDHEDARDRLIEAALALAELVGQSSAGVRDAVAALRADLARLHVFTADDEPSDSDYRYHDEHNADVREEITDAAAGLARRVEVWLGISE